MALPTLATSEDIETIISYLRTKALGVTLSDAKAALDAKYWDSKRINAYELWGFISVKNDKVTLTTKGRNYSQASIDEKKEVFSEILRQEKIYLVMLEAIYHKNYKQMTADDIASHWVSHFSAEVATGSERTLKEQVFCFMNVTSAAGLGEYLIGRKGLPTRLEVNQAALKKFMEKFHKENESSEELKEEAPLKENVIENNKNLGEIFQQPIPPQPAITMPASTNIPSLHIDIQIHIDSDATPEQIDQIFASMAKHLYNNGN